MDATEGQNAKTDDEASRCQGRYEAPINNTTLDGRYHYLSMGHMGRVEKGMDTHHASHPGRLVAVYLERKDDETLVLETSCETAFRSGDSCQVQLNTDRFVMEFVPCSGNTPFLRLGFTSNVIWFAADRFQEWKRTPCLGKHAWIDIEPCIEHMPMPASWYEARDRVVRRASLMICAINTEYTDHNYFVTGARMEISRSDARDLFAVYGSMMNSAPFLSEGALLLLGLDPTGRVKIKEGPTSIPSSQTNAQ